MDYISARDARCERLPVPPGVILQELKKYDDSRGDLMEFHRASWNCGNTSIQWSAVNSRQNVLRGVHVHRLHQDAIVVVAGEMILGLQDLRSGQADKGVTMMLRLHSDDPHLVIVPPGVAHGFFFAEPGCTIIGVTHEYDGTDELGCLWTDPTLRMVWPCTTPLLSERDQAAGSLAGMIASLHE